MQYHVKHTDPQTQQSDCLIVPIFSEKTLSEAAKRLDRQSDGYLARLLQNGDLQGDLCQTLLLYQVPGIAAERVLLVGCGKKTEFNDLAFRRVMVKALGILKQTAVKNAVNYITDIPIKGRNLQWKIRLAINLSADVFYSFDQFKTKKGNNRNVLRELTFNVDNGREVKSAARALTEGAAIVSGLKFAKDLGNLPANICTPTYMAKQALQLSKDYKALKVTVLEQKDMEKLGMGALLAVARGSHQPPKFIVLHYQNAAKSKRPVVLVGKGVTFDSGGISLKPALLMEEMKYDMCGAASVLGAIKAAAELKLPMNIVGVLPVTENLPGGNATKPGDIIKTLSGQSVEIINTDAEGRLILADALTYCDRFNPEVVIDVATLTGAVVIALGGVVSGLMSNDSALTKALTKAGDESNDRVWQLPIWEEYQEQIESNVADISNVGIGGAKAITAGCFLARFTRKYRWAHIDVAGTAYYSGKDKTSSGRPVPLLVQYLLNYK